ncbi:response regulator transcription factor [Pseudomaricurvus alkylphenolicus]|jgi:two-component system LytT family response regulator|uniref:LytR/AlgR family response regulator transcription factor n=1 Tax=Pseudomaricurvus alkylphenolicus TaxID=1306991 RepID=UPI001421E222|nr:LytTR family DNA-binding domain-containing protein [Pseudomaricurvus alkylphenolicus]NIB42637.1 response regulator transcription factor [Pseudomaricurvus alkylphenolicus]
MTSLRTLVVDDEPLARNLLKACLEDIPEIEVIGECQNGREAVQAVLELNPDLMFLDIQMPGMNGFDVVKALQADAMPMVVFSTAYQQYALDAFDVHAVDYLLKPLEEDRLQRAVERALDRFQKADSEIENKTPLIGAIDRIAKKIHRQGITGQDAPPAPEKPAGPKKIAIKDSETVTMVPETEIDWVDAAGDYMCIHVKGTTHIMRCTMKELLGKLDEAVFKRVHRSTIVNLERIEQVKPHTKGEYFLFLDCGERLKVSRNYRESIKEFLSGAA